MSKLSSSALALALISGCTVDTPEQSATFEGAGTFVAEASCGSGSGSGSGSGEEAVCLDRKPTGSMLWTYQLEPGYYLGAANVVVDSFDEAIHSRGGGNGYIFPRTTTKVSTFGSLVYEREFGGEIAVDAFGNSYVSGPFDRPMDFDIGRLTPAGIASVYLAKVGPLGFQEWVRDVRFPTDASQVDQGPTSIAVTPDGSLFAVSTQFGTVVLDVQGREKYRTPYKGEVAFASDGRLVLAAYTFNGDGNSRGIVMKFDEDGCVLWRQLLGDPNVREGAITARALAIDSHDNIVIAGEVWGHSDVLGVDFVADPQPYTSDISLSIAGYVVKLTGEGNLVWRHFDQSIDLMSDVAIDPLGSIVITGAHYTSVGAHASAFLDKLDAAGNLVWQKTGTLGTLEGSGGGVATDSCGNVLWVANGLVPGVGTTTQLIKLAL